MLNNMGLSVASVKFHCNESQLIHRNAASCHTMLHHFALRSKLGKMKLKIFFQASVLCLIT